MPGSCSRSYELVRQAGIRLFLVMGRNAIAGFRKAGKEGLGEGRFITTKCYTLELVSLRRRISPETSPSNQAFFFQKGLHPGH